MADQNKRYGLFIPKSKKAVVKTTNVFDNDSDEDTPGMALVNASLQREADHAKLKRKTQLDIDMALSEDPTVYEYDTIYDNMQSNKTENDANVKANKDKKPRYITGLLKAAEKRKLEQERMQERKIQKEREKEGDEFGDKEEFVTSAYVKKMKEMQEAEEKEKREEQMEAMLDVKKQKDMSGFYRYLLKEKSGEINHEDSEPTEMAESKEAVTVKSVKKERSSSSSSSSSESSDEEQERSKSSRRNNERERYRSRSRERSNRRSRSQERRHVDKYRRDGNSYYSKDRHKPRRSRSRERSRSHDRKDRRSGDTKYREKHYRKEHSKRDSESSRSRDRDIKSKYQPERSRLADRKDREKSQDEKETHLSKKDVSAVKDKYSESESSKIEDSKINVNSDERSTDIQLPTKEEEKKAKFAKHTTDKDMKDAKARYLARKLARERARPVVSDADG